MGRSTWEACSFLLQELLFRYHTLRQILCSVSSSPPTFSLYQMATGLLCLVQWGLHVPLQCKKWQYRCNCEQNMALVIQLQGHPWVKGLLHKTLLSHQSVAASWLHNNVISHALKVFKAFPKLPSLWCSGASVVKWSHTGDYEQRDAYSAGAVPTLSLFLLAIYPWLFSRLI